MEGDMHLRLGRHCERAQAGLGHCHEMAQANLCVPAPDQEDATNVCASMPNMWGRDLTTHLQESGR
jgi:hypothetical protein